MTNLNYKELTEGINKDKNVVRLVEHCGNLNQELLLDFIKSIESKLFSLNFERNLVTKTKTVCIEIIQNIIKHQTLHPSIAPYFILCLRDNELCVYAGNIINEKSQLVINESLSKFNQVEASNIRKYYMDSLRDSSLSSAGNAGMGLMDIMFKSLKQFRHKITAIDKNLYSFDLEVKLSRGARVLAS